MLVKIQLRTEWYDSYELHLYIFRFMSSSAGITVRLVLFPTKIMVHMQAGSKIIPRSTKWSLGNDD